MTILTAEDRVNRRWLHLDINTLHVTSKIWERSTKKDVCFRPGSDNEYVFWCTKYIEGGLWVLYTKKVFFKNRPLLDQDPPPQGLILQLPKLDHLVFHVRFDKQSCLFLLSMTAQYWIYIYCLFSTWCGLIYPLPWSDLGHASNLTPIGILPTSRLCCFDVYMRIHWYANISNFCSIYGPLSWYHVT